MNFPQPGTPEFAKLIHSQPKKDFTKSPEPVYPGFPSGQPTYGISPVVKAAAAFNYSATAEAEKHFLKSYGGGILNVPAMLTGSLLSCNGVPVGFVKEPPMLTSRLEPPPAQLDCTELEARWAARSVDWERITFCMDYLAGKICPDSVQ